VCIWSKGKLLIHLLNVKVCGGGVFAFSCCLSWWFRFQISICGWAFNCSLFHSLQTKTLQLSLHIFPIDFYKFFPYVIGFRRNLRRWIFVPECWLPSHLPHSHFLISSRYSTNQWHVKDYLFWNFNQKALWTDTIWPAKCRSEMIPKLNMEDVITHVLPSQWCRKETGLVKWWNGNKENWRNV
jgi:hypothetical protein